MPRSTIRCHLLAVPVAGVGQQHPGRLVDAGRVQFVLGGVEHRFQVPEVGADGRDLGGQDDLVLVGDGLGVVALDPAAQPLDDLRVRVGDVDPALRDRRRRVGLDRAGRHASRSVRGDAACPPGLVGGVGADLGPELLVQAPLGLLDALRAVARHRLRVRRPLGLQALLGFAQPAAPARARRELRRQLVAAAIAVELVLGRRRSRSPPRRSRARAARNRGSRCATRWPAPSCRRPRSPRPAPARCARTASAPRRTGPPAPAGGARRTGRSSRDRAAAAPRSPETRRPPSTPARSPATTGSRARRRRATAPPSSPGHKPAAPARRPDRPRRTRRGPSRRRRR